MSSGPGRRHRRRMGHASAECQRIPYNFIRGIDGPHRGYFRSHKKRHVFAQLRQPRARCAVRHRRVLPVLPRFLNGEAQRARMHAVECLHYGLSHAFGLRVFREHSSPRHTLHESLRPAAKLQAGQENEQKLAGFSQGTDVKTEGAHSPSRGKPDFLHATIRPSPPGAKYPGSGQHDTPRDNTRQHATAGNRLPFSGLKPSLTSGTRCAMNKE